MAPAEGDDGGDNEGGNGKPQAQQLTGHKRLAAAWFGEDGKGSIPREEFASFVRDLRKDVKTVECRLYSCTVTA